MATTKRTTVVGVFPDRRDAERAIDHLKRSGFDDDQIGIAVRDAEHREGTIRSASDDDPAGGAVTGAVTGGTLGGILGAIAAGLIPGVGPVLAGGILAGVLGGAAVGAAAGGLLGALAGMGVPEDEARYYDEEFRSGRTIVTVMADRRYDEARGILREHGAYDIQDRDTTTTTPRVTATDTDPAYVPPARRDVPERDLSPSRRKRGERMELREEELRAGKETVEAGKVQLEKDVVAERRTMDVPVSREEAVVERHPVDRRPSDRPISGREEIEIPLREERVTVDKQPVVYEEVEIGKRQVQDTERVSGELRREVAEVKESGDTRYGSPHSGSRMLTWEEMAPDFRSRWQQRYGNTGGRWEDYEPGYRYGYEMAHDPRYSDRDWNDLEPEFRNDYSEWSRKYGYRSDASTWDKIRANAREAWDEARMKVRGR
ncbi:MAG TPA: YsnF/AvaK domain-containing protein [Chloroflexota bacterium]|nr:YsnF/AvaK domain-containing protein [Chloroflexota bacterium]